MLGRRLLNVARAEATYAASKLRAVATEVLDLGRSGRSQRPVDDEYEEIRAEVEAETTGDRTTGGSASVRAETPEIRRFYANLELPLGATAEEVKAAYRRLMRRYHPDKHSKDPERARAANRLAHELRQAYEGLLQHLGHT